MVYAMLRPFLLASAATISTTAPIVSLRHTCTQGPMLQTPALTSLLSTEQHLVPITIQKQMTGSGLGSELEGWAQGAER